MVHKLDAWVLKRDPQEISDSHLSTAMEVKLVLITSNPSLNRHQLANDINF
jgi:hypothetical protein